MLHLVDEAGVLPGHVFISYVSDNSREVNLLQRRLKSAGIRVWRDTADLWPGEDWRARIREEITSNALVFLACFSRESVAREVSHQYRELALAIEQLRLRRPDEQRRYAIQHALKFQIWELDQPHLLHSHGRALTGYQPPDSEFQALDAVRAQFTEATRFAEED